MKYVIAYLFITASLAFIATAVHRHQVRRWDLWRRVPPLRWDFLIVALLLAAPLLLEIL